MINVCTKLEVSISIHHEDKKATQKVKNGLVWAS